MKFAGEATMNLEYSLLLLLLLYKVSAVIGDQKVRLINDLLRNYNNDARPLNDDTLPFKNTSYPVKVWFSMTYHQLQNLNEPSQIATSLVWARTHWIDSKLKWSPSEYGEHEYIHISLNKIWTPDLTLYNNANGQGEKMYDLSYQARVQSNGNVSLATPLFLQSVCHMDIKNFPFDTQKCKLRIGSWAYDSSDLDLEESKETGGIIMNHMESNSLWKYKSVKVTRSSINYTCCKFPFHDLTYTFEFQRKSLYYVLTIIIPTMLLSALTCISFCFPANSGERISLLISVVIGLYVIMLVVNERTPVTSDSRPMLTLIFICVKMSTFLSLIATAVILRLNHGPYPDPLPMGPKDFCQQLRKWLKCWKSSHNQKTNNTTKIVRSEQITNREGNINGGIDSSEQPSTSHVENGISVESNIDDVQENISQSANDVNAEILQELKDIAKYLKEGNRPQNWKVKAEWQLDISFFFFFLAVFVFFSVLFCIIS
ncbi:neuronal acetylcholine receptor subunit alpha-7-like [Xenia sp. Carnegie-2017]|uniref:neuronal acetylcholine receptor subunit alpha-7-like n=1 Tax=Xenia sp. Carnegie-2017 TaxID=2897299 RepID=UPI001F037E79|nr:neuronal acetylcholine receptor subunit alpha-7-like [Xenia sp. Carnegie-2017]